MRFVLLLILQVTGADPVTVQIPTTTEAACEEAKGKLLVELEGAGLGPAFAACVDTGRTV